MYLLYDLPSISPGWTSLHQDITYHHPFESILEFTLKVFIWHSSSDWSHCRISIRFHLGHHFRILWFLRCFRHLVRFWARKLVLRQRAGMIVMDFLIAYFAMVGNAVEASVAPGAAIAMPNCPGLATVTGIASFTPLITLRNAVTPTAGCIGRWVDRLRCRFLRFPLRPRPPCCLLRSVVGRHG